MGNLITKKERAAKLFHSNLAIFHCPVCQGEFQPTEQFFLRCAQGHHFDLARNGYINLLQGQGSNYYDKELFIARRKVFSQGLYDLLISELAALIRGLSFESPLILDAGCGEGSLLARLFSHLTGATMLGVDIARDAIRLAGGLEPPIMWCVADLAQLPFASGSLDVILNVLSPANYSEFRRVLGRDGVVLKVIPGDDYLLEIREFLADIKDYSNQEVLENLKAHLQIKTRKTLRYEVSIPGELWASITKMTPLTRNRTIQGDFPQSLTMDFELICGYPNS